MSTQKTAVTDAGNALRKLRKLARELNDHGWKASRAFYCSLGDRKFTQARVSHGALQIRFCGNPWINVEGHIVFEDGFGNIIGEANKPRVDVRVQNEGTIFILYPQTEAATEWLDANVASAQRWGNGIVVEHRYVRDIVNGMIESGLVVR
jgi:hypothetical protein